MSNTNTYWHYTTKENRDAIMRERVIRQSEQGGRDAAFGSGVYLTTRPPSDGKQQIAANNYDGMTRTAQTYVAQGRADHYVRMDLPADKVQQCPSQGRDVYKYDGDLHLDAGKNVHTGAVRKK